MRDGADGGTNADEDDQLELQDDDDIGGSASWKCPLPHAHDRFTEAHYFLHQLEKNYHDPALFRFHLHAFIAALRAVHELLQKELERAGQVAWWKERKREFADDLVLARFAHGRNISLHQRAIVKGSRIAVGLFRGRKLKLTTQMHVESDETSQSLLLRMVPLHTGFLIDEEHAAFGEQIGVERLYFVQELSEEEDVLRACFRALARTSGALAEAHNRLGAEHRPAKDAEVLDERRLGEVTVLLESDIDPEAPYRWGWIDPPNAGDQHEW